MSVEISITHGFDGLTLHVEARLDGGLTAIFGPSGAGKTTVLNIVAGLIRPDRARVVVKGRVLVDTTTGTVLAPAKRKVAMVFQEARLFPHLSVERNLLYGAASRDGLADMVDLLGLGALLARAPGTLSGGEAQRVALGRALLSDPDLLLMDEPLSALDRPRKAELLPYFERLRDQHRLPILYVSHDVEEVARLADQVILLDKGQVATIGPVAQVFAGEGLAPEISRDMAAAVLEVTVAGFDAADGLTELRLGDTALWLPGNAGPVGKGLRLRIDARDIMLSETAPQGISALNVLPVTVDAVREGPSSGALVALDHQGHRLMARITKRSLRRLGITPGKRMFAVLKSMAVAAHR
jgi:molybdate transport system ATP-binding protein